MRRPLAVFISDVHYSLSTLQPAEASYRQAIDKAAELDVPLIDSGDLTNDKPILRAEVVNALLGTMQYARLRGVEVVILVGNHSLINEKSRDHALNFLAPYATVIDQPMQYLGFHFIPYQATIEAFENALSNVPPGATLIMHQGVSGSAAGEYAYDHSAISKEILAPFRTISGHYHRAQDIKCGRLQKDAIGLMSYVGTSYTITFSEADDGPKGFQILYDDGTLEKIPTHLRKHIKVERDLNSLAYPIEGYQPGDLVWLKVSGPSLELEKLKKRDIAESLCISESFKLDLIPTDSPQLEAEEQENKTEGEIMDALVDASAESAASKGLLKLLWRKVMA